MTDSAIYIIDKSIINSLVGSNQTKINKSTIFFEYLKFNYKKAILTPKASKIIFDKIEKDIVLFKYFQIFVIDGRSIIGYYEKEIEEQELLLLAENIPVKQIFIITELPLEKEFLKKINNRTIVYNLDKIFDKIWSDINFRDWIFLSYDKKFKEKISDPNIKEVFEFIKQNLNK